MPDFGEIFKAVHIAMALTPDVEKMLNDLSIVIHRYVGPDIDKLKADLAAVLKEYQQ
jgi:hypothetical protein